MGAHLPLFQSKRKYENPEWIQAMVSKIFKVKWVGRISTFTADAIVVVRCMSFGQQNSPFIRDVVRGAEVQLHRLMGIAPQHLAHFHRKKKTENSFAQMTYTYLLLFQSLYPDM